MNKQLNLPIITEECVNRVFGKENRLYLMGVAIIWIVLFHVYLWCDMGGVGTNRWISVFDRGAMGVDIFLLLSAYGLQASIEKNSLGRFYFNRVKRLFPVYLLFLLTLFLTFERNCPIDRIVIQSVCQITGLSLFKYPEFFFCNFCFDWFTPAIILLYVFFPLFSRIVLWIKDRGIILVLCVLVILILAAVFVREYKHFPFGLLALRTPIIYIGILTYEYFKKAEVQQVLLLCIAAACLGLVSGNEEMRYSLLVLPLLVAFSLTTFRLPFKNLIYLIGRYSYEIYLGHIFIVAFFIPLGYVKNIALLLVITVLGTIIISGLLGIIQSFFYKVVKW